MCVCVCVCTLEYNLHRFILFWHCYVFSQSSNLLGLKRYRVADELGAASWISGHWGEPRTDGGVERYMSHNQHVLFMLPTPIHILQ